MGVTMETVTSRTVKTHRTGTLEVRCQGGTRPTITTRVASTIVGATRLSIVSGRTRTVEASRVTDTTASVGTWVRHLCGAIVRRLLAIGSVKSQRTNTSILSC